MIDIEKQVAYWRESAAEEWMVAHDLLEKGPFAALPLFCPFDARENSEGTGLQEDKGLGAAAA